MKREYIEAHPSFSTAQRRAGRALEVFDSTIEEIATASANTAELVHGAFGRIRGQVEVTDPRVYEVVKGALSDLITVVIEDAFVRGYDEGVEAMKE